MKDKLIKLLEDNSCEIIIRTHIPYMCRGTKEDYSVTDIISIGNHNITGYNGLCSENISQELMNEIKTSIINTIKNSKQKNNEPHKSKNNL